MKTTSKDKRKKLLDFIDKKAFDPVLKAKDKKSYSEKEKEKLEDIKRKTKNEKEQFHKDFKTAEEVKDNYLGNLRSSAAKKVYKELEHMGLPTMADYKEDFLKLCEKLEVK